MSETELANERHFSKNVIGDITKMLLNIRRLCGSMRVYASQYIFLIGKNAFIRFAC